jgi:DNA invertase Pin-like site-specific DNA recombinase
MKALIYTRVSSAEQGRSGLSLEHQAATCEALALQNGLEVVEVLTEVKSGKSVKARPVLTEALARLKAGEAQVLVVSKLDRLSRSLLDFSTLLARSEREGWSVVIGDLGLSTTTPVGRLQASIVAAVAEFERERIRERCRDAAQAKKARGERVGGLPLTTSEVAARAVALRLGGETLARIGAILESEGFTPARGGKRFYPSSVKALLESEQGVRLAAA